MKNKKMQERLGNEVVEFIHSRKSLMLSTVKEDGSPYASYAPFAIGDECFYVLLSEIAIHATNLQHTPLASVLIIQDEDAADELFARIRVNYAVSAEHIEFESELWDHGIGVLAERHGKRINDLSQLADFKLFKLKPTGGRFVKGFGRAYSLEGGTLSSEITSPMTDGHKKRDAA